MHKVAAKQAQALRASAQDTLAHAVNLCGNSKDLGELKRIHNLITQTPHSHNTFLLNLLVRMYGKCASLDDARLVFESIPEPNEFSWTIIVSAFAQNGQLSSAKEYFDKAPIKTLVTYNVMITGYGHQKNVHQAQDIYGRMSSWNAVTWNVMLQTFAQNRHLRNARNLFDQMRVRDEVAWTTLICAYLVNGNLEWASSMLEKMPAHDVVVSTAMVSANAQAGQIDEAKYLFDQMPIHSTESWNALMNTGLSSAELCKSLFDENPARDVFSWNTLISVHAQTGDYQEAVQIFNRMPVRNTVSYNLVIAANAEAGNLWQAWRIFDEMPCKDSVSWNSLIQGYAQLGYVDDARVMFDTMMPKKDVVSWSCIIAAYAQSGHCREAINLFQRMDVEPNEMVIVSTLAACSGAKDLALGKAIHARILSPDLRKSVFVGTALLNMYAKCGAIKQARAVFDRMPHKDVVARDTVTWSSLVAGYAHHSHADAILLYRDMHLEGIQPDSVTYVSILNSCSHASLLAQARHFFVSMVEDHCMVDVLGRAGFVGRAEDVVRNMPFQPDVVAWNTLLGCCKVHGDAWRGAVAAWNAVGISPGFAGSTVLLYMYGSLVGV
ncbi:hypothetical protein SELMODRAFT_114873 [Selaginella moellendorffii]|uniref:Pentacotripeptide-repeat region of PRORP domain-containing protein n=1 Tax=Selaginella moellendorffii TaxID=88036 RepID=D8SDU7_SELML|nr:hypothetical protein SELMODRAFT_114873 [Selaginella moellendorffii]